VRRIDLDWDEENVEHIAKHAIEPEEVEAICRGHHLQEQGRQGRYYLLGQTDEGRYLFIVLSRQMSGSYRVITARTMTDSERRRYRRKIQKRKKQ
jgi:uncharacterized DUF497 family protein